MARGLVNVKGTSQSDIDKINLTLDSIKTLLGQANNTGGNTTAGTIMAKLNKLLTDWTVARAEKIDIIHTNADNLNTRLTNTRAGYLDKLVNFGTPGETGGSATTGTMMAKLNKLLGDWTSTRAGYINTINTNTARLTATRAGYLDKLANFGATGDTGGSATDGSMMAKLNALLDGSTGGLKVKSVQSGKVANFLDTSSKNINIRINTIVASKSIFYVLPYPANKGGLYQMAGWDSVKLTDTVIERSVARNSSSIDGAITYSATGFDYWIVEFE